ncbi:MAG: hypothetical protein ACI8P0_006739, partial [Planctomycetaceae bacterium]
SPRTVARTQLASGGSFFMISSCLVFLQGTCTPFTSRPCWAHTRRRSRRGIDAGDQFFALRPRRWPRTFGETVKAESSCIGIVIDRYDSGVGDRGPADIGFEVFDCVGVVVERFYVGVLFSSPDKRIGFRIGMLVG